MWSLTSAAEPRPGAHLGQQVGRIRHALHATRHDDVRRPRVQGVVGHHHGLHARAAHLVHGGAGHAVGQPRCDRRLARGRLALPGGQHTAHLHLANILRLEPRALNRRGDGRTAELRRSKRRQHALKAADWRACDPGDDHRIMLRCRCHGLRFPYPAAIGHRAAAPGMPTIWATAASGWISCIELRPNVG
jgi:hypothetical protein